MQDKNEQELDVIAKHFQHAIAALNDTTQTLNETGTSPVALASATCANYVGFVAAVSKTIGSTPEEAFNTCLAGVHQLRTFVDEIYGLLDKESK